MLTLTFQRVEKMPSESRYGNSTTNVTLQRVTCMHCFCMSLLSSSIRASAERFGIRALCFRGPDARTSSQSNFTRFSFYFYADFFCLELLSFVYTTKRMADATATTDERTRTISLGDPTDDFEIVTASADSLTNDSTPSSSVGTGGVDPVEAFIMIHNEQEASRSE